MNRVFGLCVSAVALATLPPSDLQRFEAVEAHMGTLVRVTVYTADGQSARLAFRTAFDRIRDLDAILSDYKPDSELNAVTAIAVGRPVPVSPDLFAVLAASQDLARATNGAFDITQGPAVRLWREARRAGRMPDPAALRDAAARSGFRKLHLDAAHRTVSVEVPGMALDLGAIGKGYAATEAIEALDALGVRRALVAISGDLAFSGAPPGRRGWRVSVGAGDPPAAGVPAALELTHAAVSTAGAAEQHVDVEGRRYSHIIDPSSGIGLVDDLTVTVIAPHGVEADGLDTAASVLGIDRGLALIESRAGAAALFVHRTREGTAVHASSRFRALARHSGL